MAKTKADRQASSKKASKKRKTRSSKSSKRGKTPVKRKLNSNVRDSVGARTPEKRQEEAEEKNSEVVMTDSQYIRQALEKMVGHMENMELMVAEFTKKQGGKEIPYDQWSAYVRNEAAERYREALVDGDLHFLFLGDREAYSAAIIEKLDVKFDIPRHTPVLSGRAKTAASYANQYVHNLTSRFMHPYTKFMWDVTGNPLSVGLWMVVCIHLYMCVVRSACWSDTWIILPFWRHRT